MPVSLSCNLSELLKSFLLYPHLSSPRSGCQSVANTDSMCQQSTESQDPVFTCNKMGE